MTGVKIMYGADKEQYERLVGIDLSNAEKVARQILGVPSDVVVQLNGSQTANTSTILKDGDEISFYKPSGKKGC